jgi:AraC family transcriptional regulator
MGAAELRGDTSWGHTLQGVSVPVQECRTATAASEVAAIPDRDDPVRMDAHLDETLAVSKLGAVRSREWMRRVISLLEVAVGQLHNQVHPLHGTLLEATTLLRQQIDPPAASALPDGRGCLLAWQARKIRDYIDSHIARPLLVADLCALVRRSEAHFSRSFKRTFGESPHAFLVRRRVEMATEYMLTTRASMSDIAVRCGFTDQAHLCKHFRQATGQTPAAWRRVRTKASTSCESGYMSSRLPIR